MGTSVVVLLSMQVWLSVECEDKLANKKGEDDEKQSSKWDPGQGSMSSLGDPRGKDGFHRTDNLTGFAEMKKIEAIIVPCKLDAVRLELERRGIKATLTSINVQQAEECKVSPSPHTEVVGAFVDRLRVELIVGDRQVQGAVDIISKYGQVAMLRVNEALRIIPPLT